MKILQVCNKTPYPLKDGGAMAIHNMAVGLGESGHEIHILAMHTRKHRSDESKIVNYFKKRENISVELVSIDTNPNIISLILNFVFSRIPYNASRFISKKFETRLEELLVNENYDIVQFEGLYLAPYCNTVRKYSKALLVLRAHNVEHEIWQRHTVEIKNLFKRIYLRNLSKRVERFEKKTLNRYDVLIPITERDKRKFLQMGFGNKVYVCSYGISNDKREQTTIPDKSSLNKLYFIGSLDWLPNQEGLKWFIRYIWPQIQNENTNVTFSVAGRNAPEKFVRYLLDNNVDYHGEVDDPAAFIKGKIIMIAPLFSGGGVRVKIVEAMAAGRTVITTSMGAEGLDASDSKHLIIADDALKFSSDLRKLLSDFDYCLQIGKNAAKFVKNHLDNKLLISGLLDFYKSNAL